MVHWKPGDWFQLSKQREKKSCRQFGQQILWFIEVQGQHVIICKTHLIKSCSNSWQHTIQSIAFVLTLMGCFQQLPRPSASITTMPSQFCVVTFFTEIYFPFEIGFLFLQVILWYKYFCDHSCDKAYSWCFRAHGPLDRRAELSGFSSALVSFWWIPRAAGLQNYSARGHRQKTSRPTTIHILTAVLPACS